MEDVVPIKLSYPQNRKHLQKKYVINKYSEIILIITVDVHAYILFKTTNILSEIQKPKDANCK